MVRPDQADTVIQYNLSDQINPLNTSCDTKLEIIYILIKNNRTDYTHTFDTNYFWNV